MITIVADTLSSIPPEVAEKMGIPYIPQIIVLGDKTYRDDYEMNSKMLTEWMKSSPTLPKTAAPPPALYHPIFEKYASPGNTIIAIVPSAELSGTFRSASVAAEDFPGRDIRIIDTRALGSPLAMIVFEAYRWVKQGIDADTIVARIQEMSERLRIYFVVDTLENLYKGGRIGGAKMLMGSLLQMKPILQMVNGRIEPFENQRTKRRAMSRLIELVTINCPHNESSLVTIMHNSAELEAAELANNLKNSLNVAEVEIYEVPPAILVHAGRGVIAVAFFTEDTVN